MELPVIKFSEAAHLSIEKFRQMDYLATTQYELPIDLMMENAGLQLARLIAMKSTKREKILIGIGKGNNGGGGLVAARRLVSWGYRVYLDLPFKKLQPLVKTQLKRALNAGVKIQSIEQPDIFADAYLGFSQRLPLPNNIKQAIDKANQMKCPKISLDLPTGFDKNTSKTIFKPDIILTLAAMKTELIPLLDSIQILIADISIPTQVYEHFSISQPEGFKKSGLISISSS